jgi:hypothetical protein
LSIASQVLSIVHLPAVILGARSGEQGAVVEAARAWRESRRAEDAIWQAGECNTSARDQAAAPAAIRLIVQGDDMAAAHGINVATIEAYTHGILRSANVIVPGPWLPEAARLLKENPGIDAGVHLALTSEWSDVKWRPLTHAPSLVDEHGFFFPMVWPRATSLLAPT